MKRRIKITALLITSLLASITFINCNSGNASSDYSEKNLQTPEDGIVSVERGKHLVIAGACHDCHSPKIMTAYGPQVDSTRILSGHPADSPVPAIDVKSLIPGNWINFSPDLTAFVGPWGLSFSANLTPDSATGTGAWSESNFVNAIRKGKHLGMETARPIAPPMPWDNYKNLSDNDLKSIFAYLKTLTPISNRVHEPYSPEEVRGRVRKNVSR
jgi:hypothetical protein